MTARLRAFHLPERLYHGTTQGRLGAILREGLRHDLAKESALSDAAVYLATDPAVAALAARRRAARHRDAPAVVSVASADLDPAEVRLDANLAGGVHWSRSIAYGRSVPGALLVAEPWGPMAALPAPMVEVEDPDHGDALLAFDLAWDRAEAFLAALGNPGPRR